MRNTEMREMYAGYLHKMGGDWVVENLTEDGFQGDIHGPICTYVASLSDEYWNCGNEENPYLWIDEKWFDQHFEIVEEEHYVLGEYGYAMVVLKHKETGNFYMIKWEVTSYSYRRLDYPYISKTKKVLKEVWE